MASRGAAEQERFERELRRRIGALIDHLSREYPRDPRRRAIAERWDGRVSIIPAPGQAGKTVDKRSIHICIRDERGNLHDINSAMFVFVHELAHVASREYGHTSAFWENMRFLLHAAVSSGVYIYQNYDVAPISYCGQAIASNPYSCVAQGSCPVPGAAAARLRGRPSGRD